MACEMISSFSPAVKNLTLDKTNAEHRKLIRHLYRRIGYGASWADIENADGKTINAFVDELIDNHLNDYQRDESTWNVLYDSTGNPIDDVDGVVNALPRSGQNQLISNYWTNESIIGGSNSVRAKLMLFWRGHFSTDETTRTSGDQYAVLRYFKVLFNNAFGNFRTFVEEIGRTPMMLVYLNGEKSSGDPNPNNLNGNPPTTPDENYARELLELFTMGEEYNNTQNYGDEDVAELARALTGWRIRRYVETGDKPNEGEFRFQYGLHDWTSKTFLGKTINSVGYWKDVFGDNSSPPQNKIPNSNTYTYTGGHGDVFGLAEEIDTNAAPPYDIGDPESDGYIGYPTETPEAHQAYITAGDLEYKRIHEVIFTEKEDAIAYFICRKLYEFYIYGDVEGLNQQLESTDLNDYIEHLADTLKGNNPDYNNEYQKWDIIPVLKQLFKSQHFYDAGIIGTQIKSPFECGTSIFRAANLQGGWGEDSNLYDYQFKLQLLNPETSYTTPDAGHPNYHEDGINQMTGRGIDTNGFINLGTDDSGNPILQAQAVHAYRSLQTTDTWQLMFQHCGAMGQRILNPPNVAGWPGHQTWLNAFTWIRRREMAAYFLNRRFTNTNACEKFRLLAIELSNLNDIDIATDNYNFDETETPMEGIQLIWKMWRHFFSVEPTERQIKDAVAAYLEADTHMGFPSVQTNGDETDLNEIRGRILNVLLYFTEQPEYQLN